MFLTRNQVVELTGYRRPSKQINQLRSMGLRFFVAADGHPRVPESAINGERKENRRGPDFSALEKRA